VRFGLPSPYEEIAHTADVGICVHGADLAETFARAALAMSQLQAGGGAIEPEAERRVEARGEDRAALLVDLCRQVLRAFFRERLLLAGLEFDSLGDTSLSARALLGRFDEARHGEGTDVKAVTYARAAVTPVEGQGFSATLIFDV
jgi:SHS2 domain-containing protein